jgi:hypothetical protein
MKERPILFKGAMAHASLTEAKTMTRRLWQMPPGMGWYTSGALRGEETGDICDLTGPGWCTVDEIACPYGQVGDRLWVRETCRAEELGPTSVDEGLDVVRYQADDYFMPIQNSEAAVDAWMALKEYGKRGRHGGLLHGPWVPNIHMPRWASRITLEITEVRVERLRDISEVDACAEGIAYDPGEGGVFHVPGLAGCASDSAADSFRKLWIQIHGAHSWAANPWVWAITFKKLAIPVPSELLK